MTGSNAFVNPSPKRKFGPISMAFWLLWLGFIGFLLIRGALGAGCTAERIQSSDPCRAAGLYEVDVRRDARASVTSVTRLTEMEHPCAFRALVELMDLPDGRNVDLDVRWEIWKNVRERALKLDKSIPPYEPGAPISVRGDQKRRWLIWLDTHVPGATTLPSSVRP